MPMRINWIASSLDERFGAKPPSSPTAVLYPAKLVQQAGEYDPRFSQFADFEYWIRLLQFGELVYLHQPLCSFRTHTGSNTSAAVQDGRFITEIFTLINKYYQNSVFVQTYSLSLSDRRQLTRAKTLDTLKNIKDLIVNGNLGLAWRYLTKLTSARFLL